MEHRASPLVDESVMNFNILATFDRYPCPISVIFVNNLSKQNVVGFGDILIQIRHWHRKLFS